MKIYLSNYQELALTLAQERYNKRLLSDYPCPFHFENVQESFNQYLKGNMHYNTKQGKTISRGSWISYYSDGKPPEYDINNSENLNCLINSEFLNHIFSSANRLFMGHKTI